MKIVELQTPGSAEPILVFGRAFDQARPEAEVRPEVQPAEAVRPEQVPARAPRFSGATIVSFFGICLLFLALRWHAYDAPLMRDEGEFAYAAKLLTHGIAPYEHSFLQKPPMVVYYYALADLLLPNVHWVPRLFAYLCVGLATGLLAWAVNREFGTGHALGFAWLATPLVLLPGCSQTFALSETFMLLPLAGTVALYVRARHCGGGWGTWFLAGATAALTLLHKYTAAPLVGVIFLCWIFEEYRREKAAHALLIPVVAAALGAVLASAAALGFFFAADGGKHLWECTVQFNRAYLSSNNFGWSKASKIAGLLWSNWQIAFLLPAVLLLRAPRRAGFWLLLLIAAALGTGASYYAHYYIVLMPFWAVLLIVAARELASMVSAKLGWDERLCGGLTIAATVILLCVPALPLVLPEPGVMRTSAFNPINPFPESRLVARRVCELTSATDYVLVAGSEPQILYYANRLSPTRFVIAYPMMIPSSLAEKFQREAIRDIQEHPPAVVVRSRSNTSWLTQPGSPGCYLDFLERLLKTDYEPVGGFVLGQTRGAWREPIRKKDLFNASLVVYRKKESIASSP